MKTKIFLFAALISISIMVAAGFIVYVAATTATPEVEQSETEQPTKQSYYSLPSFIPMAKVGY
jgi:hypothetical protein